MQDQLVSPSLPLSPLHCKKKPRHLPDDRAGLRLPSRGIAKAVNYTSFPGQKPTQNLPGHSSYKHRIRQTLRIVGGQSSSKFTKAINVQSDSAFWLVTIF
jgi:hypothetical protein